MATGSGTPGPTQSTWTGPGSAVALLVLLALLALLAPAADAFTPLHGGYWPRGRQELGVAVGFASGRIHQRGGIHTNFFQTSVRWALHSGPVRGAVGGNFAFAFELTPFFTIDLDPRAYGFGFDMLVRYMFKGHKWRPLVQGGAGVLLATDDVPTGESAFNYTPQVGVGLQYFTSRRNAFGLEYRFHHTSNNGLTPDNPGIDAHLGMITFSWY